MKTRRRGLALSNRNFSSCWDGPWRHLRAKNLSNRKQTRVRAEVVRSLSQPSLQTITITYLISIAAELYATINSAQSKPRLIAQSSLCSPAQRLMLAYVAVVFVIRFAIFYLILIRTLSLSTSETSLDHTSKPSFSYTVNQSRSRSLARRLQIDDKPAPYSAYVAFVGSITIIYLINHPEKRSALKFRRRSSERRVVATTTWSTSGINALPGIRATKTSSRKALINDGFTTAISTSIKRPIGPPG